ncbi:MAG: 30S ribosomal protein S15 [Phycisphaerales bacterium]|jgi:small subunit ribosomal protein S15
MAISEARKAELIKEFATHEGDTGSADVQIAVLTENIRDLTEHLKEHRHDFSSRRGLLAMVSKRNRLSAYLKKTDRERYMNLIQRLGLRK